MTRHDVAGRPAPVGYPFSAIVGHELLRLALVLCAVRPEIGGVLIRGEKGTAKSTAVRGLAAVLAETDQYVAFGSEYRALVNLPGIENAKVWEPEPATVYFWER